MSIGPTKPKFTYSYAYQKGSNQLIKTKQEDQEDNAISASCNNEEAAKRQKHYPYVCRKIMDINVRLLSSMLSFSDGNPRHLKSLASDDFEKIKQAFHKYLPSPSNRNLDRIDLNPLQFTYRNKVKYKISHEMREIIRDGVNTIIDEILENRDMEESQDPVSRKTNRETIETLMMSTHDNSNQDSSVKHQPKKTKTAVRVNHEFAHDPVWFEQAFGLDTNDTKTTSRSDPSSSTREATPLDTLLFPPDYDVFPFETNL